MCKAVAPCSASNVWKWWRARHIFLKKQEPSKKSPDWPATGSSSICDGSHPTQTTTVRCLSYAEWKGFVFRFQRLAFWQGQRGYRLRLFNPDHGVELFGQH